MSRAIQSCIAVVVVGSTAVGLAACGAAPEAPAPGAPAPTKAPVGDPSGTAGNPATTSAGPATVGGMTSCTKDELAEAATGAAQAMGADNVYTIDDLRCAEGWAVTTGLLADKRNPGTGAPTSFVFEQEGQFWVLQDKAKVCGTRPTTTTAPADAAIPAALFIEGCAAG